MRWQQVAQKAISEGISLSRLPFGCKFGFRVLSYHSVGGNALGDNLGLSSISIELFKNHVALLTNYRTISKAVIPAEGNDLSVGVTFDDGYKDNLYTAAPILLEKNIPFTVFIATDLIAKGESGFLTPAELKELAKFPNITIGAHGKTHSHLTQLSNADVFIELRDSKSYLEDLLGAPIQSMSYPYGDVDVRIFEAVKNVGYINAFTSRFAINTSKTDPLLLNRCAIISGDSLRTLRQKIEGDWDWRGIMGNHFT